MNQYVLAHYGSVLILDKFQLGKRPFFSTVTNNNNQINAKQYLHIVESIPVIYYDQHLCVWGGGGLVRVHIKQLSRGHHHVQTWSEYCRVNQCTPETALVQVECSPPTTTLCLRYLRKSQIQVGVLL